MEGVPAFLDRERISASGSERGACQASTQFDSTAIYLYYTRTRAPNIAIVLNFCRNIKIGRILPFISILLVDVEGTRTTPG